MIAEGLAKLAELVRAGCKAELVESFPRARIFNVGGSLERVETPAPPRSHKALSLGALVAYANTAQDDTTGAVVVWYGGDAVTAILNDEGHRDERVKLDLETSGPWDLLRRLEAEEPWMDLRNFTRMLRVDLADCIAPADLLEPVKRIRFENGTTVRAEVSRNRESLGREITSRVEAEAGMIPERVNLLVPVYVTPGADWTFQIRCAVETDPATGRLQLLPLAGETARVQGLADSRLAEALDQHGLEESIPRYHGRP